MGLGVLRPSIGGRHSLAVLTRVLDAFRLRAVRSLLHLVSPILLPRRLRHYPPASLLSTQTRLAAAKSLRRHPAGAPDRLSELVETTEPKLVDGNVVPYQKRRLVEEISAQSFLERLCIPAESFHFTDLRRGLAQNGEVLISAEIHSDYLQSSSGLCLAEVGRQLSQLGLVAVSACDTRRSDLFYVATNASMEDFHTNTTSKPCKLTGLVRVVRLQAHDAQTELELWRRDCLVCRMSVQYDVLSSWQEVLPSLANTSTSHSSTN